jgi:hypothetical protein
MNIGFETIGNATVICYDKRPILVTDPWVIGSAYFGSWTCSHEIPVEQMEAIKQCQFVWISHGHPDHLSPDSLQFLKPKTILLPDHRGNRICEDLTSLGYNVHVLQNRVWTKISERITVLCIADYNQDAVLLIDINGCLVVDINDAGDHGWMSFVKRIVGQYKTSFLLKLQGKGDADMINFFDENGKRIMPPTASGGPVGSAVATDASLYGVKFVLPFSSMHKYQRSDSAWANEFTTDPSHYREGFSSKTSELLPAFIRYDCEHNQLEGIDPPETKRFIYDPRDFGDDWSDQLESAEEADLRRYFNAVTHLGDQYDFITFRVGGKDTVIEFAKKRFHRGITFEVPRNSLMLAVRYEVFDDLLIGNFMKTTLHGITRAEGLYPHFTPYVAKYGDNGKVRTKEELREYFKTYRQQSPLEYFRHVMEDTCRRGVLAFVAPESLLYKTLAAGFHLVR